MTEKERAGAERDVPVSEFEMRATDLWPDEDMDLRSTGDGLSFEGYALKWNRWSVPIPGGPRGSFREMFREGSMERTLARNPDVMLSYQHLLTTLPLARTRSGTLSLQADNVGLLAAGSLPDNELGRPVRDSIKRKDIAGMSIRFRVPNEKTGAVWSPDYGQREIIEAQLGPEISFVTFPAYPDTTAAVRHLAEIAELPVNELLTAFEILNDPDARLTNDQRDILMVAINKKTDEPFVSPTQVRMREQFAARWT